MNGTHIPPMRSVSENPLPRIDNGNISNGRSQLTCGKNENRSSSNFSTSSELAELSDWISVVCAVLTWSNCVLSSWNCVGDDKKKVTRVLYKHPTLRYNHFQSKYHKKGISKLKHVWNTFNQVENVETNFYNCDFDFLKVSNIWCMFFDHFSTQTQVQFLTEHKLCSLHDYDKVLINSQINQNNVKTFHVCRWLLLKFFIKNWIIISMLDLL